MSKPTNLDYQPDWVAEGDHDGYAAHTKLRATFYLLGQMFHLEAYQVKDDELKTATHPAYEEHLEAISSIAFQPCCTVPIEWEGVTRDYIVVAFPAST